MNKRIITNDELKEIAKQTWVTAKDIEKIACVSKKESYRLKKIIIIFNDIFKVILNFNVLRY